MGSSQSTKIHPARRRFSRASAIVGLSAVLIVVLGWSGLIFVVGGLILPAWAVASALCITSVVLAVIDPGVRVGEENHGSPPAGRSTAFLPWLLISLGLAGSGLAIAGDAAYSTTYTLLKPAGPDGCQAVVREGSFFMGGHGEVYAVQPWGLGWRTGSWTADDGIRPIEDGQYGLSWGVGSGSLVVHGENGNPVWPALHDVNCF